jgi:hypothetical protein
MITIKRAHLFELNAITVIIHKLVTSLSFYFKLNLLERRKEILVHS